MTGRLLLAGFLGLLLLAGGCRPSAESLQVDSAAVSSRDGEIDLSVSGAGFDQELRAVLLPSIPPSEAVIAAIPASGLPSAIAVQGDVMFAGNLQKSLQSWDIREPARPRFLGAVFLQYPVMDLAVRENLVYVANGKAGVVVVEMQRSEKPRVVATVEMPGACHGVTIAGNLLLAANGAGGLQAVDLTDPRRPRLLGNLETPGKVRRVAAGDGFAYLSDTAGGFLTVDIRDPSQPRLLAALPVPDPWGIVIHGHLAYLADRQSGIRVIDIQDPRTPETVGLLPLGTGAYGLMLLGKELWIANIRGGIQVAEIGDPRNPEFAGGTTDFGGSYALAAADGWICAAIPRQGEVVVLDPEGIRGKTAVHLLQRVKSVGTSGDKLYLRTGSAEIWGMQDDGTRLRQLAGPAAGTDPPPLDAHLEVIGNHLVGTDSRGALHLLEFPSSSASTVHLLPAVSREVQTIAAKGSLLYTLGAEELNILDLALPAAPKNLGSLKIPGLSRGIALAGDHLFAAAGKEGLIRVDVADPRQPRRLGAMTFPWPLQNSTSAQKVHVRDDLIYLADGRNGLQIFDGTGASLRHIGDLSFPEIAREVTVWEGWAFVALGRNRMAVADVRNPREPLLIGYLENVDVVYLLAAGGRLYILEKGRGLMSLPLPLTGKIRSRSPKHLQVALPATAPGHYALQILGAGGSVHFPIVLDPPATRR